MAGFCMDVTRSGPRLRFFTETLRGTGVERVWGSVPFADVAARAGQHLPHRVLMLEALTDLPSIEHPLDEANRIDKMAQARRDEADRLMALPFEVLDHFRAAQAKESYRLREPYDTASELEVADDRVADAIEHLTSAGLLVPISRRWPWGLENRSVRVPFDSPWLSREGYERVN